MLYQTAEDETSADCGMKRLLNQIYLSLFIHPSIDLPIIICLTVSPFICLSVHLFIYLFVCLLNMFVCLCACLSLCLSVLNGQLHAYPFTAQLCNFRSSTCSSMMPFWSR